MLAYTFVASSKATRNKGDESYFVSSQSSPKACTDGVPAAAGTLSVSRVVKMSTETETEPKPEVEAEAAAPEAKEAKEPKEPKETK